MAENKKVTDFRPADALRIKELEGSVEEQVKLRNLGLCEGREVRIVRSGDPMLLQVYQSNVGVSRRLAERIYVQSANENIGEEVETLEFQNKTDLESADSSKGPITEATIALLGNPNTGKTTLFNLLSGLKSQTANFPGTTIEVRMAKIQPGNLNVNLVDLPGLYSLQSIDAEQKMVLEYLSGQNQSFKVPDAAIVLVDAQNPQRSLYLQSQLREIGIPHVVVLSMIDLAKSSGMQYDVKILSEELGCPVIPMDLTHPREFEMLHETIVKLAHVTAELNQEKLSMLSEIKTNGSSKRFSWVENVIQRSVNLNQENRNSSSLSITLDRILTHPISGMAAFALVLVAIFYTIFSLASIPMDLIDFGFGYLTELSARIIPGGMFQSLVAQGVIPGIGGVVIFLPQIMLLFFIISMLEDSGYLARGAFVIDRMMRKVGLPGKAFVPILSAHACAIPAIMSTRAIDDAKDRLVTILVLPLMTCSARLPVYTMVAALLFSGSWALGALIFTGAYLLGLFAAFGMAWIFRRTLVPSQVQPLLLELPSYRLPRFRNAFLESFNRSKVFVFKAGQIILIISIALWWLSSYPGVSEKQFKKESEWVLLNQQISTATAENNLEQVEELNAELAVVETGLQSKYSFAGRAGRIIEPILSPLGYDWRISIGILASFAAREVVVSTLIVLFNISDESDELNSTVLSSLANAKYEDGRRIFNPATSVSLLIFFVLAMQCLPTQAVTKRETGSWKWAIIQIVYMSCLAYGAAFIGYQSMAMMGLNV